MQRRPNISRAKALLDWRPSVPLEEGLRRTVAYFDDLLAGRLGTFA
jgi:UDP-glucuronate decarboxylase